MKKNKKQRFINFLDKTLDQSGRFIYTKLLEKKNVKYPLVLKFIVKDIKYLRFVKIAREEASMMKKLDKKDKIDCLMVFDRAKTIHHVLSGKILPLSSSLIGKLKIIYLNYHARCFSAIYNPAKNNYLKIIKGTRFTLNKRKNKDNKSEEN